MQVDEKIQYGYKIGYPSWFNFQDKNIWGFFLRQLIKKKHEKNPENSEQYKLKLCLENFFYKIRVNLLVCKTVFQTSICRFGWDGESICKILVRSNWLKSSLL